jgi:hypothetical protein
MTKSNRKRLARLWNYLAESSWVAYGTIGLLQLKVMFWIWRYRDLAPGDTAYYYKEVFTWLNEGRGNIVRSPAYTLFLAALHRLIGDPFWVLVFAQIGIAVCGSLLALALLRRLLPKHIAWIIAAWWALLPINFDTVYNVHLFSALFVLATFVIAARCYHAYGRGLVLGGLLLTAVLVRNEYLALFLLWAFIFAGYEIYLYRKGNGSISFRKSLVAYGVPLVAVFFMIGIFYARAKPATFPEIEKSFANKQTENLCQIYAFNKKQQGFWQGNPWLDCDSLLERDFGRSEITFAEAFSLNPPAILQHLWWNFKLIPSGTQLALFNFYAGGPNPDYMRAKQSPWVLVPFALVIGLCAFGAITSFVLPILRKQPIENKFVWLLMLSASLLVVALMIMQRPRPSYMFPYTLSLMALTGLGLQRLLAHKRLDNVVRVGTVAAGILLILLVPSFYNSDYTNHYGYKGQPLRKSYERIAPHIERKVDSQAVMVAPAGGYDYDSLCGYLGVTCTTANMEGGIPIDIKKRLLASFPGQNVYVFYLEEMIWKFKTMPNQDSDSMDYVQLNCFSLANNIMTCSDGTVDLSRGIMRNGTAAIPLHSALFVNDGYVIDRKDYRAEQGYYLQVLMKNKKIDMILVADDRLFRSNFNQQFLLGNYDRGSFEEVDNDSPNIRILKLK